MSGPREGDFELVSLRGGAWAVRHVGHGEVMHPAGGPWEESNRLYVRQLELARRLASPGGPLRVLDVGLGAGTNAAAVLACARELPARRPLELHSLEVDLAPLRLALKSPEAFPFLEPWREAAEALIARGEWEGEGIRWRLTLGDARSAVEAVPPEQNLVLFDPFSPKANPTLWTPHFLARIRSRCREDGDGALLATYSAATPTRVSLLLAGFYVGAGTSTGTKGETTLAATRLEALDAPLGGRWLERWRRSTAREPHGEPLTPEAERRVLAHPQFGSGSF